MKRQRFRNSRRAVRGTAKILWVENYYDGALQGVCKYKERFMYFALTNWHEKEWVYKLHSLSNAEVVRLISDYEKFRRMVGTNWDHFYIGRNYPETRKYASKKYFNWKEKQPTYDYTKNPVIGYIHERNLLRKVNR